MPAKYYALYLHVAVKIEDYSNFQMIVKKLYYSWCSLKPMSGTKNVTTPFLWKLKAFCCHITSGIRPRSAVKWLKHEVYTMRIWRSGSIWQTRCFVSVSTLKQRANNDSGMAVLRASLCQAYNVTKHTLFTPVYQYLLRVWGVTGCRHLETRVVGFVNYD